MPMLSNSTIFNDLESPLHRFQGHAIILIVNISETVRDTDSFNGILIATYTQLYSRVSFQMTLSDLEWTWRNNQ